MKKLFAVLLLVNLAVFAWSFQRSEKPSGSRHIPQLEGVPRITLVSELPPADASPQPPTGEAAPAAEFAAEAGPPAPDASAPEAATQSGPTMPPSDAAIAAAPPKPPPSLPEAPSGPKHASAAETVPAGSEDRAAEKEPLLPGLEDAGTPAEESAAASSPQPQPVPEPEATTVTEVVVAEPSREPAEDRPGRPRCFTIGPFAVRDDATQAERALTEKFGQAINLRKELAKVQIGYWVVIPPQGTAAQAIAKVAELKNAGVTDLWRFTRGELANAISLGLFTGRRYAENHRDEIARLGFDPEVRPRFTDKHRYWVDLSLKPGEELLESDWRSTASEESADAEQAAGECR